MKKIIGACLLTLAISSPAFAQFGQPAESAFSIRLFGLGASQQFAATNTFNAVFGTDRGMFWGGGVEVVHSSGLFADVEYSRFKKTGQRAFINNGQAYQLGIPLTATIAPIDVMAGYRLRLGRSSLRPYVAAGLTSMSYNETSTFNDPNEDINTKKAGVIFLGGVEMKLTRELAASLDIADTRVTGILGTSGVSQQANENDLGGVAFRFRVILGR